LLFAKRQLQTEPIYWCLPTARHCELNKISNAQSFSHLRTYEYFIFSAAPPKICSSERYATRENLRDGRILFLDDKSVNSNYHSKAVGSIFNGDFFKIGAIM